MEKSELDLRLMHKDQFGLKIGLMEEGFPGFTVSHICMIPHPLMAKGINVERPYIIPAVEAALEGTIFDLGLIDAAQREGKELSYCYWRKESARKYLDQIKRDGNGNIVHGAVIRKKNGLAFENMPFIDDLFIDETADFNICGYSEGDPHIRAEKRDAVLYLPLDVVLTPELCEEFEMSFEGLIGRFNHYHVKTNFYSHNLSAVDDIFFRNLALELNNAIVKERHS